ncbi:Uma2 family endonuclease [Aquisphaera insulae]|uniref:Uma2 family endonuclease n=1 Tax=Aquisphaera insulae TaxID=2712864 RepID=UPI0013EC1B44|nr:Uma2 family endonuclease [Aquisphaera insulae]
MSATSRPTTARKKVVYPDSDGRRMADNTRQFQWIVTIKEGLEILFRDRPDVFVAGDLLWYAREGDPRVRMAPDAMVVFGRPKGYRGSYMQWAEDGLAPQVVFEVHSPGNRRAGIQRKFDFYQDHGVEEYYYYNPDKGTLTGWRRVQGGLRPIPDMNGYVSPRLGIRFEPGKGPDSLTIRDPDGQPFLTAVENAVLRQKAVQLAEAAERKVQSAEQIAEAERQKAEAAERKVQSAEQIAEAERQKAEAAERKAERLAAKLRELGIEPE